MENSFTTDFKPISLQKWLTENAELLRPPVSNRCIYTGNDFFVMVVAGPNQRTDYHINPTEEWFYQVKGELLLKVVDKHNKFLDVRIQEGDMFLLPALTPHSPQRFQDTVGLVLERRRPEGTMDMMRWYCEKCNSMLHEVSFRCDNLNLQLGPVIESFYSSEEYRTCKKCGLLNPRK